MHEGRASCEGRVAIVMMYRASAHIVPCGAEQGSNPAKPMPPRAGSFRYACLREYRLGANQSVCGFKIA